MAKLKGPPIGHDPEKARDKEIARQKKRNKKPTQGGARPGAGRKSQFDEETVRIGFRVPKSQAQAIKDFVAGFLSAENDPIEKLEIFNRSLKKAVQK